MAKKTQQRKSTRRRKKVNHPKVTLITPSVNVSGPSVSYETAVNKRSIFQRVKQGSQNGAAQIKDRLSMFAKPRAPQPVHVLEGRRVVTTRPTPVARPTRPIQTPKVALTPEHHASHRKKALTITFFTLAVLAAITFMFLYSGTFVGKAIDTGGAIVAKDGGFVLPVTASEIKGKTVAIEFAMTLPKGIDCKSVAMKSKLGFKDKAHVVKSPKCANNKITFTEATLDPAQAKTGKFAIADIVFKDVAGGSYNFTYDSFNMYSLDKDATNIAGDISGANVTVGTKLTCVSKDGTTTFGKKTLKNTCTSNGGKAIQYSCTQTKEKKSAIKNATTTCKYGCTKGACKPKPTDAPTLVDVKFLPPALGTYNFTLTPDDDMGKSFVWVEFLGAKGEILSHTAQPTGAIKKGSSKTFPIKVTAKNVKSSKVTVYNSFDPKLWTVKSKDVTQTHTYKKTTSTGAGP